MPKPKRDNEDRLWDLLGEVSLDEAERLLKSGQRVLKLRKSLLRNSVNSVSAPAERRVRRTKEEIARAAASSQEGNAAQ